MIVIDLETGGFKSFPHEINGKKVPMSPIIQIGAVSLTPDLEVLETFERKISFKEDSCDPEALKRNCYDKDQWDVEAVSPLEAIGDFQLFLNTNSTVERVSKRSGKTYKVARGVGHNFVKFDLPMLQAYFRYFNEFLPIDFVSLDTMQVALFWTLRFGVEVPNYQLGTLCKQFGIPLENEHDALADAKATHELLSFFWRTLNEMSEVS